MTLYYCKYHKRKSNKSKSGQGGSIYIPDDCDVFKDGDKLIAVVENNRLIIAKDTDVVVLPYGTVIHISSGSKKQENQP